ncbi:MAG TPA: SDR family NAD(P)-dependent oxidoreductase [Acidimicrobiales bacterium]|nr:SDR family NAD(P)-dependent oxidoreductase [Acidimicrobiales bacterium]
MSIAEKFRLNDKVAIVTGASSGLGVAFARALAEAGANVVLGARRTDGLEATQKVVEEAGAKALVVATDVTSPEECAQLVAAAMEHFGRVDILVNNAGVGTAVPATREDPAEFRKVVDVNVFGSFYMAQACARVMKPGSSIINLGSVLGSTTAELPQAAYSSSKAAIIGLTRDLAQQWTGRKGIRVNAIAPGYFPTEMTEQFPPGYMEGMIERRVPIGRPGELESYITGIVLPVDGGLLTT